MPKNPYVEKNITKINGKSFSISLDKANGKLKTQINKNVLVICTNGYIIE